MVTNGSVGLNVCGCVDVCILTWVLGLCFDRSLVYTLMVLLDLICISFLGVCSSCEECFDPFGGFFFYIFYVRVTESGEVGYGTVTVRITGG